MRTNINLATEKYQDSREFYLRWGGALALLVLITAALALLTWSDYKTRTRNSRHIRELNAKIAHLDEERRKAEAKLNSPENRDVRDQSQFWNDVIDQKSFSWTQLFSDLEKIMPARAYVISAEPTITADKRLQLKLVFAGEKFDDANDLLAKMEHSERFRLPQLDATEVKKPEKGAGAGPAAIAGPPTSYQFEIITYYTPAAPLPKTQGTPAKKGA